VQHALLGDGDWSQQASEKPLVSHFRPLDGRKHRDPNLATIYRTAVDPELMRMGINHVSDNRFRPSDQFRPPGLSQSSPRRKRPAMAAPEGSEDGTSFGRSQ
ncbi:unnamed protein product, partial [Polarella glacialis]